jgi:hypothetical protein
LAYPPKCFRMRFMSLIMTSIHQAFQVAKSAKWRNIEFPN